ncbi:MAG: HD domain-containing protein [Candidatus Dormibacteraeota bacterium]|nr:HD domain-containing protein [Candidatus Dormibacteraeota bacterium]
MDASDRIAAGSHFRLAELMAAISLATDLGMGQPMEQTLRTCLIAVGLGARIGLGPQELSDVYYVALLRYLGCTADAYETAKLVGGDDIGFRAAVAPVYGAAFGDFMRGVVPRLGQGQAPQRRLAIMAGFMARGSAITRQGITAHCEVGESLARRIGLGEGVRRGLAHAFEGWNGHGFPAGLAGDQVAVSARIVTLARDAEVLASAFGPNEAVSLIRHRRTAGTYEPALVDTFVAHGRELLELVEGSSVWEVVLAAEPQPHPWVPAARLDAVLEAFADFADLKSPYTIGHSRGVADLAGRAATGDRRQQLRRAALLHDLGRTSVPNAIWDWPGPLSQGQWERVRLHPYYSERILSRCPTLQPLATLAGMHHERLDGSGYHRSCQAPEIAVGARILAAADAYQAMTQERPHRAAVTPHDAARQLSEEAAAGRLDREAVHAILLAAGHPPDRRFREWPADLTDREVEVLRLLCRGSSKKQVAADLHISPSTADHHVRHIYQKTGASTRAGAAIFALEHGLIPK